MGELDSKRSAKMIAGAKFNTTPWTSLNKSLVSDVKFWKP